MHFENTFLFYLQMIFIESSKLANTFEFGKIKRLVWLPSERATLSQAGTSASWLAQNGRASSAHNHSLGMAEDRCDLVASWALDIHEVWVWMLHKTLQLVLPLLLCWRWVKQISSKRHGFCAKRENNFFRLVF